MSRNDKLVQITFSNSNSNSTRSVKYLIRPNYYIQIKKTGTMFTQQLKKYNV